MNNKIISEFSNSLTNPPFLIQIAKDHKWEQTWNIDPLTPPTNKEIQMYLNNSPYEAVMAECLFKDEEGNTVVFGIVHNKKLKTDETEFIKQIVLLASQYSSFNSFIENVEAKIVGRENMLYQGLPDMVRIGVFNNWFSVGVILAWEKRLQPIISKEKLNVLIDTKPEVKNTHLNFQGISFIFHSNELGLYHWIKPQCGKKINNIYTLDTNRVYSLFTQLLGFKITK